MLIMYTFPRIKFGVRSLQTFGRSSRIKKIGKIKNFRKPTSFATKIHYSLLEIFPNQKKIFILIIFLGGDIKTEPDIESLGADWFNVDDIKSGNVNLRGTDFFKIMNEAIKYREWRKTAEVKLFSPILNVSEVTPGLFIEFVIVKQGSVR